MTERILELKGGPLDGHQHVVYDIPGDRETSTWVWLESGRMARYVRTTDNQYVFDRIFTPPDKDDALEKTP